MLMIAALPRRNQYRAKNNVHDAGANANGRLASEEERVRVRGRLDALNNEAL